MQVFKKLVFTNFSVMTFIFLTADRLHGFSDGFINWSVDPVAGMPMPDWQHWLTKQMPLPDKMLAFRCLSKAVEVSWFASEFDRSARKKNASGCSVAQQGAAYLSRIKCSSVLQCILRRLRRTVAQRMQCLSEEYSVIVSMGCNGCSVAQ